MTRQQLEQTITDLEADVLRAEARAYGRVFNTALPVTKDSVAASPVADVSSGGYGREGADFRDKSSNASQLDPLEPPNSIRPRWWLAAFAVSFALWYGILKIAGVL